MVFRRSRLARSRIVFLQNDRRSSDKTNTFKQQLSEHENEVQCFSSSNDCVDFLLGQKEPILLVLNETQGEQLAPIIQTCDQIHRIYVLSTHRPHWIEQYGFQQADHFDSLELIIASIKHDLKVASDDQLNIAVISRSEMGSNTRKDPSFVYHQLLKEILLKKSNVDPEEIAKQQMVQYFRKIYRGQPTQIQIIDEFDQEFFPELAFYWYSRDCFLYETLNRALFTPEPTVLYKLRYFIRHLHAQILEKSQEQPQISAEKSVYRGQGMKKLAFDTIKNGIGGLLSFNNFLSTTTSRSVAEQFMENRAFSEDEVCVLLQMNLDPTNRTYPFAKLGQLGYFGDAEKEILFSMGTVFRIMEVSPLPASKWLIKLTLCNDNDQNLEKYTDKVRQRIKGAHPLISFVKLMDEIGQYNMIEPFDDVFAEDEHVINNPLLSATLQHAIGSAYLSTGDRVRALAHLKNALESYLNFLPENHQSLSPTYNNIGSVYYAMHRYQEAIENHQLALDCQLNCNDPDLDSVAAYSLNLSAVHQTLGKYQEALKHLERVVQVQKQHLKEDDPALADTYMAQAKIYHKIKDNKNAGY